MAMNTRACLENIYFNVCTLLNWAIIPEKVSNLQTAELIEAIAAGLEIIKARESPSITCPRCRKTSYNSNDILNKYCGNCHSWHSDFDALVELYRQRLLSLGKFAERLGIPLEEAKQLLRAKNILLDLGVDTIEELEEDIRNA